MGTNPKPKPEFLAEPVAAEYIGMSIEFLRDGRCRGVRGGRTPSPPYHKLGRAVRYLRADLDRWLAERRVDPAARRVSHAIATCDAAPEGLPVIEPGTTTSSSTGASTPVAPSLDAHRKHSSR